MALTPEEFEGKTVRSLKTSVAKQIGVSRFRQRWLSEDHTELKDEDFATASDVQLLILDFLLADDLDVWFLLDACLTSDADHVDEFLRKPLNPNANAMNATEGTPLYISAKSGHAECAALLLEAGADTEVVDCFGMTALHVAAQHGNVEVVRLLLEAGADKDRADWEDRTALHWAVLIGNQAMVQLSLEADTEREAANSDSRTALHVAAQNSELQIVQLLLEAGVNQNLADSSGWTVLHLAAEQGHLEVVKLLLEAGPDTSDDVKMTALQLAAENGHLEAVKLLELHGSGFHSTKP